MSEKDMGKYHIQKAAWPNSLLKSFERKVYADKIILAPEGFQKVSRRFQREKLR
jgi:hypothetical protein